ncbi:neuromedin-U-like [Sinocyclocheilus grahami]|uniref:neuromedin-U-like n=1 Tax=Sinocyclocheilus grahami TaxID=75366 RepID=UPI0007ACF09A|nr:PREDICTED: neuromedin-U-like [Sinocyclocheilus grahami]
MAPPYGHGVMTQKGTSRNPYTLQSFEAFTPERDPVLLNPSIGHEQLLTQITELCSFYLSADPSFRTSDVLEDLCFLMLGSLQKSEEITARETSKRSTVLHPLLELIPQLARRRSRRMKLNDDLQGPGRIQSRGYFLYRPRNGRRSDEYV